MGDILAPRSLGSKAVPRKTCQGPPGQPAVWEGRQRPWLPPGCWWHVPGSALGHIPAQSDDSGEGRGRGGIPPELHIPSSLWERQQRSPISPKCGGGRQRLLCFLLAGLGSMHSMVPTPALFQEGARTPANACYSQEAVRPHTLKIPLFLSFYAVW